MRLFLNFKVIKQEFVKALQYTTTALVLLASTVYSLEIHNGILPGELGHFRVDVLGAGDIDNGYVTAKRSSDGNLTTDELIYEYIAYISLGMGEASFELATTRTDGPSLTNQGAVYSKGQFTGSGGNTIGWETWSSIEPQSSTMVTTFRFVAQSGTLGELILNQYLDEDVNSSSGNDFLLRTGSLDARNLQLFTLDSTDRYGISHSGALSPGQGLVNSEFIGWGADEYSHLRAAIRDGSVVISKQGSIVTDRLPPFLDESLGQVYGLEDVTSTMAWRMNPGASEAVVLTTLGGVPEARQIQIADTFTITYSRGVETMLEPYWENVRMWNYTAAEWMVFEDRYREPGTPYEFTNLDPDSAYWFGSWNYSTSKLDMSVIISAYNLNTP
jgi:hypothetical protein